MPQDLEPLSLLVDGVEVKSKSIAMGSISNNTTWCWAASRTGRTTGSEG